ncbi:uncharacterized protein LOC132042937 [Lycium ferocissimum]|uniref:uncharacterized protein LOC132042937 n=1 Tax=Lycium ferocissimum TaxID=112874 RepID=UPI002815C0F5|nr:uncharacterized protein LOC132042937 [Lycium ferocissimum]
MKQGIFFYDRSIKPVGGLMKKNIFPVHYSLSDTINFHITYLLLNFLQLPDIFPVSCTTSLGGYCSVTIFNGTGFLQWIPKQQIPHNNFHQRSVQPHRPDVPDHLTIADSISEKKMGTTERPTLWRSSQSSHKHRMTPHIFVTVSIINYNITCIISSDDQTRIQL